MLRAVEGYAFWSIGTVIRLVYLSEPRQSLDIIPTVWPAEVNQSDGALLPVDAQPSFLRALRSRKAAAYGTLHFCSRVTAMHRRFLFDFEPKHRVLYWSLEGRLTDEYFREGRTEVARLVPKLLPLRAAIADFSDVLAFEVSNPTILEIANSPSLVPDTTTNIIVAPERHLYGLGRMFSVLAEKTRPNLRVLRTREEAIELLGLKDPRFEPVSL